MGGLSYHPSIGPRVKIFIAPRHEVQAAWLLCGPSDPRHSGCHQSEAWTEPEGQPILQFFNPAIFLRKKLKPLLVTIYGLGSRARLITPTKKESPFGGAHVEGLQHRLGPNFFISINTSIKQFLVILSVPILIAEKKWVISSQVDHCKASCTLGGSRTVGCLMSTFLGTEKIRTQQPWRYNYTNRFSSWIFP